MGRLTRDPELRTTSSNTPYVNFTLAVDRDYTDQKDEKPTDFIDCVAWRNTAEFICKYFSKGRMLVLNGSLQVRSWTDKDNNKRRSTEVLVVSVYFGDSKRNDPNSNQNNTNNPAGNSYGGNGYGGGQGYNGYGGNPAGNNGYPGNNFGGGQIANGYGGNQGGGNGYPSNNFSGQNNYGGGQNNGFGANGYGNNQSGQNYGGNGGYTNFAGTNGFSVSAPTAQSTPPAPSAAPQSSNQEPPVADMSQPYQNGFGGASDPKFNV